MSEQESKKALNRSKKCPNLIQQTWLNPIHDFMSRQDIPNIGIQVCNASFSGCRRKFKTGKDVRSKPERLKAVVCENGWPGGILGIGRFWDDPEALVGVVDESDDLTFGRCDRPRASEEVECRVVVETALKMKGQVEIEQGWSRHGPELGAFLVVGFLPSLIGGESGSSATGVFVVPIDLGFEEVVGLGVIGDFFKGQESDQTFLEDQEAPFDFTFGLCIGSYPVMNAQGRESPLELRVSVQAVCWRTMTEQAEAIGIEAGWQTELFENEAQVREMAPGGIAGHKSSAENFSGMVVEGQNEGGIMIGGPPAMGRGIMLPEFANGGTLPASSGFGAWS